jgi:hypothetical protein
MARPGSGGLRKGFGITREREVRLLGHGQWGMVNTGKLLTMCDQCGMRNELRKRLSDVQIAPCLRTPGPPCPFSSKGIPLARGFSGFDHGVGHPLLFLGDKKVPNCPNNKWLKELGNYSEWPKVADTVIKAAFLIKKPPTLPSQ